MYRDREKLSLFLSTFTIFILPHINPDGEEKNKKWMKAWPNFESYIENAFREKPGRDLEFGFPNMRVENQLWSQWLLSEGPFSLHISFHGMGYSEGPMLLIERHWIEKTKALREAFCKKVAEEKYFVHDHDRRGDKGFLYIAPGFTTTPEGGAMRDHFYLKGDTEMASKFHQSSMEWIRSLGGDPLCLVTELPLFCIHQRELKGINLEKGLPVFHLALKQDLKTIPVEVSKLKGKYDLRPFELNLAMEFQLFVLKQGLKTILV